MRSTTFRIPADLVDKLDAYTSENDSDRSAVIRDVLKEIADGMFVPSPVHRGDLRLAVRVDEETFEEAAAAVAEALGSDRKLNAAVIQGLQARLDAGDTGRP